jgi:hypothetical protein
VIGGASGLRRRGTRFGVPVLRLAAEPDGSVTIGAALAARATGGRIQVLDGDAAMPIAVDRDVADSFRAVVELVTAAGVATASAALAIDGTAVTVEAIAGETLTATRPAARMARVDSLLRPPPPVVVSLAELSPSIIGPALSINAPAVAVIA